MDDETLISGIKSILMGDSLSDITFVCTNCNKEFECTKVGDFIMHQISNKHFDYEKIHK